MGGVADGRSCADPCCLNNGLANNLYLYLERSSHPGPLLSLFCFSNVLLAMGCRSDGSTTFPCHYGNGSSHPHF